MKVFIKVQRIVGTLSRMRSRMLLESRESPLSVFFQEKIIFDFFAEGQYHICNIYTYIQKISYFHVLYFLRKIIFHFSSKEKISYFLEKNTIFPDNTRKIKFQRDFFWKDHLFGAFEENIIFPYIFLR